MKDLLGAVFAMCAVSAVLYGVYNLVDGGEEIKERRATSHKVYYQEEAYTLKDGTPCTIIRGGDFSGMVGVTCNYK